MKKSQDSAAVAPDQADFDDARRALDRLSNAFRRLVDVVHGPKATMNPRLLGGGSVGKMRYVEQRIRFQQIQAEVPQAVSEVERALHAIMPFVEDVAPREWLTAAQRASKVLQFCGCVQPALRQAVDELGDIDRHQRTVHAALDRALGFGARRVAWIELIPRHQDYVQYLLEQPYNSNPSGPEIVGRAGLLYENCKEAKADLRLLTKIGLFVKVGKRLGYRLAYVPDGTPHSIKRGIGWSAQESAGVKRTMTRTRTP